MKQRNKVIFLCTGNICRSPMAEALLKHAITALPDSNPLKKLEVVSAGTSTIDGMQPSANSILALEKVGIDINKYRSTALTDKMLDECFVLFGLAQSHIDIVKSHYANPPARMLTLLELSPIDGRTDVPDPYGGSLDEYFEVRDDIIHAIPSILNYLQNELKKA